MQIVRSCLAGVLLLWVAVMPAFGKTDKAADASNDAAGATAPGSEIRPAIGLSPVSLTGLLDALVKKGVLSSADIAAIRGTVPQAQLQALIQVLVRKGALNAEDLSPVGGELPASVASAAKSSEFAASPAAAAMSAAAPRKQSAPVPQPELAELKQPSTSVVPAIVPLRVLAFDPPKSGGLTGLKLGPVTFAPYGFVKSTAEHDSSSPNGDDFPIPAGLMLLPGSNTGPSADPEFHMKARQSRIGINFEWPSITKKMVLTGRFEADFEGNFNESDNADVTSIRNPNLRMRLAYVRVDYSAAERTSLYFVGGQDWTLFGSKALPNMLDTTWNAADYGAVYNRSSQFRFGVVQKLGDSSRDFKISPELAVMMPSSGQVERLTFCSLAAVDCGPGVSPSGGFMEQVGEAERQGADSDRPELNAGLTMQFKIDTAAAVAPAQIFWTGMYGERKSVVPNSAEDLIGDEYPTALLAGTALAKGFTASSSMYGNQIGVQVPTRWFTVTVSGYRGADMREVLGGQLTTNYTDTTHLGSIPLTNANNATPAPYFLGTGLDNVAGTLSGFAVLGCSIDSGNQTCEGADVKVAPEHGVRSYGGFVEVGLPLSRWFNANPKGPNAGWQLYFHAGRDQLVHRDAAMQLGLLDGAGPNTLGQGLGIPMIGSEFIGATLYYKINQWCTFGLEPTHYGSRAIPELGKFWTIAATPSRIWQDQRVEFGPVFTF